MRTVGKKAVVARCTLFQQMLDEDKEIKKTSYDSQSSRRLPDYKYRQQNSANIVTVFDNKVVLNSNRAIFFCLFCTATQR
jgi:hypothetical protein